MTEETAEGVVYLGGCGWGLPEGLPSRLREFLPQVDAIFYQPEWEPFLLELVPPHFPSEKLIPAAYAPELSQWTEWIERVRSGQTILRLYIEDPTVYPLAQAEARWLQERKIPFRIFSGSNSLSLAASFLQTPVTEFDRESMRVFVFHLPEEWDAFLQRELDPQAQLLLVGRTPTGALQVRRGHWGEIRDFHPFTVWIPPIVVYYLAQKVPSWEVPTFLEQRPLYGVRVVVTRARHQISSFVRRLRELGADVLPIPTIRIERTAKMEVLDEAISGLNAYDWVIFTSVNGVNAFFERFFERFEDMRDFGGARIAAVGPATAARLKELRLMVDLIPKDTTAAGIAKELAEFMSIENLRVLLLRAENATSDLPQVLEDKGAIVDDIPCYRTLPEPPEETIATRILMEQGADWLTFFSGSSVEHFHERFHLPKLLERFPQMRIATLGPQATHALQRLGIEPTVEVSPHTMEAMVEALQEAVQTEKKKST